MLRPQARTRFWCWWNQIVTRGWRRRISAVTARVSVGIDVRDEPEVERRVRAREPPHHRHACAFVPVDAADDEHLLGTLRIADLICAQRPSLDGMADDDRGYDVQHQPAIVGNGGPNCRVTFETA